MDTLNGLRKIALAEGISFLVLLFIAMPLKYGMDMPWAVRYIGMIHGVLFIAYILLLIQVHFQYRWSYQRSILAGFASIIPFGPFWADKKLFKN